ncbi:MAG TPA: hypothetical protein VMZ73_03635 [Acidimicrobiales bacterium]|nr:hypothetical protein [Acidimicrobiales bacterium]
MIRLDAATVLLQWATGGLFFLWVTTRQREVGIGYGWLLRTSFGLIALGAVATGALLEPVPVRDASAALVALTTGGTLVVSIIRRKGGVAGERVREARRVARVGAAATRIAPPAEAEVAGAMAPAVPATVAEFAPQLDLMAPMIGVVGLVAAGIAAGGPAPLAVVRTLAGAAFLGAVTDAMLLGHWYLVQPGLGRAPLNDLNRWLAIVWPVEVAALLWPTGMLSVISGRVDDGYGGVLGWFWVACAGTTLALTFVTRAALKERAYSAVMAATGLLYLAILTAFGTDLVARAILA